MEIQFETGDLLKQGDCDGLVNSANRQLLAGSGVSGAIHRAAGPQLQAWGKAHGPIKLAQAVVSPGYNLPNRWIIHVAAPRYFDDANPHEALALATRAVLDEAKRKSIYRIAMPGLSIGVYRFPVEEAAVVTAHTLFAERMRDYPMLIRMVFLEPDITQSYKAAFDKLVVARTEK